VQNDKKTMRNKKIMTHIVAGYPTIEECEKIAVAMSNSGVDFIEIQIPFSDPVADGPVIMAANQIALNNGVKVADCFMLMKNLTKKTKEISAKRKFLFMTYFNILFKFGVEKFCKEAKKCGCYGLIVPDMPIDEEKNEHYLKYCKKYRINPIQVVSPLTSEERLKIISKHAKGFIYCVSRYGITGVSNALNNRLKQYLAKVKRVTSLPLAVGFGISNHEQIKAVHKYAEIAVVGSKFIEIIKASKGLKRLQKIMEFCRGKISAQKRPID
jgi:tryptophan synthase alpha subunit